MLFELCCSSSCQNSTTYNHTAVTSESNKSGKVHMSTRWFEIPEKIDNNTGFKIPVAYMYTCRYIK